MGMILGCSEDFIHSSVIFSQSTLGLPTTVIALQQNPYAMQVTLGRRLHTKLKKFMHKLLVLQVSHRGGTYSIERTLALGEYTRNTSPRHALFMCMATPLPMILLALSQELIPLQDPRDGWEANYGFLVRAAILCGVIANTMAVQATYFVEGIVISRLQLALITAVAALGGALEGFLVVAYVTFPIPFAVVTMYPPYMVLLIIIFRVIVGDEVFRQILLHRDQFLRFAGFIGMEIFLVLIYPAYQTLFKAATETDYELLVILLLPILKFAMKYLVTLTVIHVEDMMPEAVIVTVDFFNAIFLATSMQSATSMKTVVVIMAIDLTQTAMGLLSLYRRTEDILTRLHDALVISHVDRRRMNILSAVCLLCQHADRFEMQYRGGVRLDSTFQHHLLQETKQLLEQLRRVPKTTPSRWMVCRNHVGPSIFAVRKQPHSTAHGPKKLFWKCAGRSSIVHSIVSISPLEVKCTAADSHVPAEPAKTQTILREALAALFTSECLVLTEFLELIIPTFYGTYVLIMVHLPSAKYHTELTALTPENVLSTVQTIFVYALLELVSFVVLAVIMERNCGLRALSQLAFVLRTQLPLVQGKMMLWMAITLAFRVVHFGGPNDRFHGRMATSRRHHQGELK